MQLVATGLPFHRALYGIDEHGNLSSGYMDVYHVTTPSFKVTMYRIIMTA
jgi:hypothetical protein